MNALRKTTVLDDAFIARVRMIQSLYPEAHAALVGWGRWSADRRGIFPQAYKRPAVWDQFKQSEAGDFGEEGEARKVVVPFAVKAEGPDRLPYDERSALILDERIHHPGGLSVEVRHTIRAAYVTREIPEDQFPRAAGCSEQAFCERLEAALIFARRFS